MSKMTTKQLKSHLNNIDKAVSSGNGQEGAIRYRAINDDLWEVDGAYHTDGNKTCLLPAVDDGDVDNG